MSRIGTSSALAALFAVAALALLLPLLGANFHSDDLGWLAFARHAASPWPAFVEPQIFGYFYRPSAFVYWWLAERVAAASPSLHYALAIGLHAASGGLFALWLRRSGLGRAAAALGGLAVLACLPFAGTAMWLSSRNETLAIAAGLAALALAVRASPRQAAGVGVLLAVACTAKETGLLFAAAVGLQAWVDSPQRRPWRLPVAWAAGLPIALALAARQWIVLPIGPEAEGPANLAGLWANGVLPWWRLLPDALSGWGQAASWPAAVALVAAAALAVAGASSVRHRGRRGLLAAALLLLVLPSLLQSPITSQVLSQQGAEAFLVNLRFYATAAIGVAVFVAAGVEALPATPFRRAALAVLAVLVAASGWAAHAQAQRWRAETAALAAPLAVARLLPPFAADRPEPACVLDVRGTGLPPGLAPYLDSAVRALAPRGQPPACLVLADGAVPYFAFFDAAACRPDAGWARRGLAVPEVGGRRLADRFGPLCQIALRPADGGVLPSSRIALSPPAGSP